MMLTGLGTIDTVAQTIQQVEGYYPGSLAYINQNPGNLRPAGQPGCTTGAGGFCAFPDYATGYQALLNQITMDASRGLTIEQFMAKYAPASDGNDPTGYAATIANASGLSPSDALSLALADGSVDYGSDWPDYFELDTQSGIDPMTIGLALGAIALAFMVTR